jgi:hypothetical protein
MSAGEGLEVEDVVNDPASDLLILWSPATAAPDFEGPGLKAEIGGGFCGGELLVSHDLP